jgi:hypothetical protein
VDGEPQLLEIILARRAPGRFARSLYGRHEQPDEDADNDHHDQQLD